MSNPPQIAQPSPPASPTPGWKTSEFWITAATAVLGALISLHVLGPATPLAIIAGAVLTLFPGLVYTWHRSKLKAVIAAGQDVWQVYRQIKAGTPVAIPLLASDEPTQPIVPRPSPSLRPTVYAQSATPGGAPQAIDPEDPK